MLCGIRQQSAGTIEFGGPAALNPLEVVALFEEIGGKPFKLEHIPEEALRAQFEGATDSMQKSFAALMLAYSSGDAMNMIKLTSIDQFALIVLGQTAAH